MRQEVSEQDAVESRQNASRRQTSAPLSGDRFSIPSFLSRPPLALANSYLFRMLLLKSLDTLVRFLFRQCSSSCGRRYGLTCCLLILSTLLPSLRKNLLLEAILGRSRAAHEQYDTPNRSLTCRRREQRWRKPILRLCLELNLI